MKPRIDLGTTSNKRLQLSELGICRQRHQLRNGWEVVAHPLLSKTISSNLHGIVAAELVVEDVVVSAEADSAADVADTEGDGCDGADEFGWCGELGDDGAGDDDGADAEGADRDDTVDGVEVVGVGYGHCAGACSLLWVSVDAWGP